RLTECDSLRDFPRGFSPPLRVLRRRRSRWTLLRFIDRTMKDVRTIGCSGYNPALRTDPAAYKLRMGGDMATRILIFFAIVGVSVAQSSAQVSMQSSTTGASSFSGGASFGPAHPIGPVVTGAPYSGEEVSENVKILADGKRITQKMVARKVWRDSEGRTRTERPLGMGPNQASMPTIIENTDPVASFKYTL